MQALERELELATRAILASEAWAPSYAKAPEQHAELIKLTAKTQRLIMRYLRDLAKHAPEFVNWFQYGQAVFEQQQAMRRSIQAAGVQAYDVNVVVKQDNVNQSDQQFIKVLFDTVATTTATGAASMEVEYARAPVGMTSTGTIIQDLTTKQLANLVGMKVQKDGTIVPNPKPEYNIDETTRTRIANSIKTSIRLGEAQEEAVARLEDVIADPARAEMIAYTETVRAYAEGRNAYAQSSGAVAKNWTTNGATDFCVTNEGDDWIPLDQSFSSGAMLVPGHPLCRCGNGYSYDQSVLD